MIAAHLPKLFPSNFQLNQRPAHSWPALGKDAQRQISSVIHIIWLPKGSASDYRLRLGADGAGDAAPLEEHC